jgi:FkbM family methyltransferase
MISTLRYLIRAGLLPMQVCIALSHIDKKFLTAIPAGRKLRFDRYQGSIVVNVDTTYPIEREMLRGQYDKTTSRLLKMLLREDSTVMDVGANVGALTLLMAKIANRGQVIAVEPGPFLFERLQANIALNPRLSRNVITRQVGLGTEEGELFWSEDPNNRGNAGLLQNSGVRVSVVTLDSLVDSLQIHVMDFIKIDVEGMEYEVIMGGLRSIKRLRPLVYFETLEAFRQIRGFDLYGKIQQQLTALDYELFFVDRRGLRAATSLEHLPTSNTLAVPKEKVESLALNRG